MQFDFDFPSKRSSNSNHNMEQFMEKVNNQNNSFDWDNFNALPTANEQQEHSKSNLSDIFDHKKTPSNSGSPENSNHQQHQKSRDILQISYMNRSDNSVDHNKKSDLQNRSFRFEKSALIQQQEKLNNSRYERIQQLLTKAKQNNLDAFYRNLNQMGKVSQEPVKFENKNQFRQHIRDLKTNKRQKEEKYTLQKGVITSLPIERLKLTQNKNRDFSKKLSSNLVNANANNFLPQQYNNYDEDNNQDFQQFDFQVKPRQFDGQKQAKMFMSQDSPKKKKPKKQKKQSVKLDPIRQQKATLFEKTFEEQKLNMLLANYKDMRGNFQELMHELKDTNEGQNKIVEQLKKIKQEQRNLDKRQYYEQKKQQKQKIIAQKKQQFEQIKQQINKIKQNNKQLLFLKITQKIQTLQSAVKSALQQIAQEKEQSFTPKIINYFCQGQRQMEQNQGSMLQNSNAAFSQEADSVIDRIRPDQNSQSKFYKHSKNNSRVNNAKGSIQGSRTLQINRQQFISPFDIAIQDQAMQEQFKNQRNYYDQGLDQIDSGFEVPDFAKPYYPKVLDPTKTNKNLRKSLTQKTSLIFQSFQFHVSARFIMIEDETNPLMAQIRVGNKCMINLSDVFVIVYGNQGADVPVRPSKIYHQIVKNNQSFSFEVFLDKKCLEDNGFYVQISYKTDIVSKKKVNFKVPVPIIQLIKPQFIYQQQFVEAWRMMKNQMFIPPKTLDFMHIRSHEDLKLILPFTYISQQDNPNIFSYGIMFKYPKSQVLFLLKLECSIKGKASIHLRSDRNSDIKIKQEILDVLNYLIYSQ